MNVSRKWWPEQHNLVSIVPLVCSAQVMVMLDGKTRFIDMVDMKLNVHSLEDKIEQLCFILEKLSHMFRNCRLDVIVSSKEVSDAWSNEGSKILGGCDLIKRIFSLVFQNNINLRVLCEEQNCLTGWPEVTLSRSVWDMLQEKFGPHTIDLMASQVNAQVDSEGKRLPFFSESYSVDAKGNNLFCQDISSEVNPYVFPPNVMLLSVLRFLQEQKVSNVTVVMSVPAVKPIWWPLVKANEVDSLLLGNVGKTGILKIPTKRGFVRDKKGLKFDLWAFRLSFTK
jgi:hypothetical protein